jgi:hypothetical protein
MTTLDFANQTLGRLKAIKLPEVNRTNVTKFFYEYFLCLSDQELKSLQDTKRKREK